MSIAEFLKEGSKHYVGAEETTFRNIEACKDLAGLVRTSLGPNGMNKMVINHIQKLFVTNDAATIIKELDVAHPAAKMLVQAAKQQEKEIGDNTNYVVILAGELLQQADSLLRMGLPIADVISGYEKSGKKALDLLQQLVVAKVEDINNEQEVVMAIKSAIASKQYGREDFLAPLIARACIQVTGENLKQFNVDNIRVCKIPGGGIRDSTLIKGLAIVKNAYGSIKHVQDAKIAVFAGGFEISKTETKGTVLLTSAKELLDFSNSEEELLEEKIKSIAQSGANVLISGGTVSALALHFIEKYDMMVIKEPSKFQLRRICRATGASALVRLDKPTPDELGTSTEVVIEEVGSTSVCFFKNDSERCKVSTLLLRGATSNILDDIERCVDDGVNVYKALIRNPLLLAGAGAVEMEIEKQLLPFGESAPGLDQYSIKKYAEAFEVIPRTLAENAGLVANETISSLKAAHQNEKKNEGINIEEGTLEDSTALGVFDLFISKYYAIKLATNAAVTVLKVDQIIMSKPAGGPMMPKHSTRDSQFA
eukprot:TRINITY_DN15720_c0_g1_i1.p1 TRINITY_DN15720_c0_g1~~TRINITY_DN15720_c0_g1_i1.p1  ORF type:complete len:538 (-),score=237.21 TRINITY_DN15720_c0_g1_i1:239-1852(-)